MPVYALEAGKIKQAGKGPITVIDKEELDTSKIPYAIVGCLEYEGVHSCKVDFDGDWVYGNIIMPAKGNVAGEKHCFRFLCSNEEFIIIKGHCNPQDFIEKPTGLKRGFFSIGDVFLTTLFMPITVVSAWYAMNFRGMPELDSPYGCWIVTGITLLFTVSAILFCKKEKML